MTNEVRTSDLDFILQTPGWPMWPYLPLKKRAVYSDDYQMIQNQRYGVLVALDFNGEHFLWLEDYLLYDTEKLKQALVAQTRSDVKPAPGQQMSKSELQTLINDGWVVD